MIDWKRYIPLYRREPHSLKNMLMRRMAPRDWSKLASIETVAHGCFDLEEGGLYDPAKNRPHQRGQIQGFVVNDGVLWPGVGAVRTSQGQLIAESFFDETSRRVALERGYISQFQQTQVQGAATTIGHLYRNYYHRWVDSISRLYALYHPALQQLERLTLCVDDRFSEEELIVIHRLVPDNVVVKIVGSSTRVRADQCVHLPFLSRDRVDHSKWFNGSVGFMPRECLDWLREEVYSIVNVQPSKPFRKLYVTRRNATVRRLTNEHEVASYLRKRGFNVVALETLSLRKQIRLFAEAKIIVAQHGAGLVNLLFAQFPRVLEVCSDKDRRITFRLLSEARDFPHLQIHRNGSDKNADVKLPIPQLQEGLAKLQNEVSRVSKHAE